MRWTMPPQPVTADTYDAVEVDEVVLRFPEGEAKSGGEVRVRRVRGDTVLDSHHFALNPGEADDVPAAFTKWVLGVCAAHGFGLPDAKKAAKRMPKVEAPAPVSDFGVKLG